MFDFSYSHLLLFEILNHIPLAAILGVALPRTSAMNHTTGPSESSPAISDQSPFTVEIIIGLLALTLALAGVVVAVAQYLQVRDAQRRHSDIEAGVEMPIVSDQDPDISSGGDTPR